MRVSFKFKNVDGGVVLNPNPTGYLTIDECSKEVVDMSIDELGANNLIMDKYFPLIKSALEINMKNSYFFEELNKGVILFYDFITIDGESGIRTIAPVINDSNLDIFVLNYEICMDIAKKGLNIAKYERNVEDKALIMGAARFFAKVFMDIAREINDDDIYDTYISDAIRIINSPNLETSKKIDEILELWDGIMSMPLSMLKPLESLFSD